MVKAGILRDGSRLGEWRAATSSPAFWAMKPVVKSTERRKLESLPTAAATRIAGVPPVPGTMTMCAAAALPPGHSSASIAYRSIARSSNDNALASGRLVEVVVDDIDDAHGLAVRGGFGAGA